MLEAGLSVKSYASCTLESQIRTHSKINARHNHVLGLCTVHKEHIQHANNAPCIKLRCLHTYMYRLGCLWHRHNRETHSNMKCDPLPTHMCAMSYWTRCMYQPKPGLHGWLMCATDVHVYSKTIMHCARNVQVIKRQYAWTWAAN